MGMPEKRLVSDQEVVQLGQSLMDRLNALQEQNKGLRQQNEVLSATAKEQAVQLERFEDFKPLLDAVPESMQIYIRDKRLIKLLLARSTQMWGNLGNPELMPSHDKDGKRKARFYVDTLIQACCLYCMDRGVFSKVHARYLSNLNLE